MLELEDHVDFVARGIRVERRIFEEYPGGFPNGEDRSTALENFTVHFLEEFMQARPLHVEGASVGKILTGLAGAIGKAGDLGDQVDDIHSEAIDPAVQPPAHHFVDGLANFGVLPVQVGLFFCEEVEVVLTGMRVVFPHGT